VTAVVRVAAAERRGALSGAWFAASAFAVSRVATFVAAAGIALISEGSVGRVLSRWDGGWYLSIAAYGYPSSVPAGQGISAQSNLAFFPGYPLLVRALSDPIGISPVLAGCAISLVAGWGATVAIRSLATRLADDAAADRAAVLFVFLPAAFVLSMVYADALFLLLAAWCLIALLDQRWAAAGALAAAAGALAATAGLVRPTGVALFVACAWAAVASLRSGGPRSAVLAPLLAPLGSLSFLAYLWIHTGHPLAFFEVQSRGWNNRFDLGWSNLRSMLPHLVERRPTFFVAMVAIVAGAVGVGLWLLIRWRAPGFIVAYVAVVLGLAVTGSNPSSIPRFLLGAFPILIPIARAFSPRATAAVAGASAVLMATLFFVTGMGSLPP
jgi:hypothetical protein